MHFEQGPQVIEQGSQESQSDDGQFGGNKREENPGVEECAKNIIEKSEELRKRGIFDKIWKSWDEYGWPILSFVVALRPLHSFTLGHFAKIKEGDRVLELGAGYPLYKIYSGKVGESGTFVSLDYHSKIQSRSKRILDWVNNLVKKKSNPEALVVADAQRLPFEDDCFNVIIASNLTEATLKEWSKEALRVLKTDGSIVVSFYEIAGLPFYTWLISGTLKEVGFKNIKWRMGMPGVGGLNWFVVAEK